MAKRKWRGLKPQPKGKQETVFIACPNYAGIHPWTHYHLIKAMMNIANDGYRVLEPYMPTGMSLVTQVRNAIAKQFLKSDADWLLSVDSDMIFPFDIFQQLRKHDKDVVAALCVRKAPPHAPTLSRLEKRGDEYVPIQVMEMPIDKIFRLDGKNGDCMGLAISLIKREVIEKMEKPLYYCPRAAAGGGVVLGEDWIFCLDAKKQGFEVWADPVIGWHCFHIGHYPFGLRDYMMYKQKGWSEKVDEISLENEKSFADKYRGVQISEGSELKEELTPTVD